MRFSLNKDDSRRSMMKLSPVCARCAERVKESLESMNKHAEVRPYDQVLGW
ncbi:hypothetical protein RO3G_16209 [Rhizopus delemar RA 99-880]|uniref:Uncharacterized protein n=1 Tax=Rhizopus delemar (strain RA 99-880 / ATCC MYA-4621 / FGSC 9543 / NRRL 43880) TaxID=246409 RepID=I1CSR8_RHIO9|nr:hypothetical protein RO3G_16209 [Rhizopus delemar RA 99-880]|eukprot:EIE91498.1 hypothetical protein RO3G_16209 [Rhizopus delemar RA 99-880]